MISTITTVYRWARHDRYARWAVALVWLGVLIGTSGIAQLHMLLRQHPLTATEGWATSSADGAATPRTAALQGRPVTGASRARGSAAPVPAASPVGAAGITPRLVIR